VLSLIITLYCSNILIAYEYVIGKFYLIDSGYPNRHGYLAPYKGTKYHLLEFHQGP
jgi:hypothetical protein